MDALQIENRAQCASTAPTPVASPFGEAVVPITRQEPNLGSGARPPRSSSVPTVDSQEQQIMLDTMWNFEDSLPRSIGSHDKEARQGTASLCDLRLVGQSSRLLRLFMAERNLTCQPDITPAHGFHLEHTGVTHGLQQTIKAMPASVLWICLPPMGTDGGSRQDKRRLQHVCVLAESQLAMGDNFQVVIEGGCSCNSWGFPKCSGALKES